MGGDGRESYLSHSDRRERWCHKPPEMEIRRYSKRYSDRFKKLEMEVRGEIERIPGRVPQRLKLPLT